MHPIFQHSHHVVQPSFQRAATAATLTNHDASWEAREQAAARVGEQARAPRQPASRPECPAVPAEPNACPELADLHDASLARACASHTALQAMPQWEARCRADTRLAALSDPQTAPDLAGTLSFDLKKATALCRCSTTAAHVATCRRTCTPHPHHGRRIGEADHPGPPDGRDPRRIRALHALAQMNLLPPAADRPVDEAEGAFIE